MDHTGVTPPVAFSAPDLVDLALGHGPFLTVYLTTEAAVENAAQRAEVRWKDVRIGLADQGVDEANVLRSTPPLAQRSLPAVAMASAALCTSVLPSPLPSVA